MASELDSAEIKDLIGFIRASKRGICGYRERRIVEI
jgi:hypothetical protein